MIGNLDALIEESMPAIKSVLLEDMIKKLPEELETELGDRSLILFGGLKQHVAIVIGMSAMV